MITELKYPKDFFKQSDVLKEKNKMQFSHAWEIHEDKNNYLLKLNKRLFEKFYTDRDKGNQMINRVVNKFR